MTRAVWRESQWHDCNTVLCSVKYWSSTGLQWFISGSFLDFSFVLFWNCSAVPHHSTPSPSIIHSFLRLALSIMRPSTLLLGILPIICDALNVVQSNDDGWAEINIRETYNSLSAAGYDSFISAPAENQSGTGSRDEEPEEVGDEGCQFGSCPPNSPAIGRNETEPRFNVRFEIHLNLYDFGYE